MAKKQTNPTADLLPDLPNYNPEPADGVRVGESLVQGVTLKRILRGHSDLINPIAWSPDGRFLASPSFDRTIRIWDMTSGKCMAVLRGHEDVIYNVTWSPDGRRLVSNSGDATARIWGAETGETLVVLKANDKTFNWVEWSPNDQWIVSVTESGPIQIWYPDSGDLYWEFAGHGSATRIAWSPDGHMLASANDFASVIEIRDIDSKSSSMNLHLASEKSFVNMLCWSPNGQLLLSGTIDSSILIWDVETGNLHQSIKKIWPWNYVKWAPHGQLAAMPNENVIHLFDPVAGRKLTTLEGHTKEVLGVSFAWKGDLLASIANDGIRLWHTNTWETVAVVGESFSKGLIPDPVFHPYLPILATFGEKDTAIRIWELDMDILHGQTITESVRYTTAKLVLVGDSGVGKTGLGWRLAHGEFKEHASTHGQQFWVIDELGQTRADGTECEAVLWDLAGQPDYRLVHSLFLDDVDTALVLLDPTNRQEPLSGVDFWLNQLKNKEQDLCNSILVGARADRGTSTLTEEELQAYCKRNNICGGYIATSALKGDGLDDLMGTLKAQIPWDEMTATVTTLTFKRIKEYVLALKEQTGRKNVLVQPAELRVQLQATDPEWEFSDAEMMTAVGHLATHGYVTVLHGSQGAESILLAPDLLANLASSIVLEARRNPRGLGVLEESRLLAGDYTFPELQHLAEDEREILLDAAAVLFLEHNLCFRETFNQQTFLVFPSLINEKRPKDENVTPVEGASYRVKGAVENVYASLVVLLGYTNTFIRTHQWQNQAQYEMGESEICGFQQSSYGAGEIELVLYYAAHTPEPVRLTFRGLFERFLSRGELEISRYQPVFCSECGGQLARNVVMSQLAKDKDFSFCSECGKKLSLPSPEPLTRLSRREEEKLDAEQAVVKRRTAFEAALVRVKALLRDRGEEEKPTCFISYAWGVPEHERWVLQLAKDLRNAGVDVLLDQWHCQPGDDLGRYIDQIEASKFVVVEGTSELKQKYDSQTDDRVVAAELELINFRAHQPKKYGRTTLPLLKVGDAETSFPPQLQRLVSIDFRQDEYYFRQLFDTIWRVYDLPRDHAMLEELRASMSPRRE